MFVSFNRFMGPLASRYERDCLSFQTSLNRKYITARFNIAWCLRLHNIPVIQHHTTHYTARVAIMLML